MTTPTPDELKAVCGFVYPKHIVYLKTDGSNEVRMQRSYGAGNAAMKWDEAFNPKLDGNDREQAQACQTIVAAMNLGRYVELKATTTNIKKRQIEYSVEVITEYGAPPHTTYFHPDILTASIAAILSHLGAR